MKVQGTILYTFEGNEERMREAANGSAKKVFGRTVDEYCEQVLSRPATMKDYVKELLESKSYAVTTTLHEIHVAEDAK